MSHFIPQPPNIIVPASLDNSVVDSFGREIRIFSKEFYLRNRRFICTLRNERDLFYFCKIWVKSSAAPEGCAAFPLQDIIRTLINDKILSVKTNKSGFRKLVWKKIKNFKPYRSTFTMHVTEEGTPDRSDGTEQFARRWARRFYTENAGFLKNAIRNRKALTYFYKIWIHSSWATKSGFFGGEKCFSYRPFRQVLFALVNDGKVCHVKKLRDTNMSAIIWHRVASDDRKSKKRRKNRCISQEELDSAVREAVRDALEKTIGRPKTPPYTPITPPISPSSHSSGSSIGDMPPPLVRRTRMKSIYPDDQDFLCGYELVM